MTAYPDIMGRRFEITIGIGIAILGVAFVVAPVPTAIACVAVTVWMLRDYVPGAEAAERAGVSDLIPIEDLAELAPARPLSSWSTRRLIRERLLGHVRIGRRLFVTQELLDEYVRTAAEEQAQPAPAVQEPAPRDDLYAIAGVYSRRVKVGRSAEVETRLARLQYSSPDHLVLLRVAKGYGPWEPQVHRALEDLGTRLHGEWFTPRITEAIANVEDFTVWIRRVVERHDERIRDRLGRRR